MKTRIRVHIRWMIRVDLPRVVAIEQASFASPWSEPDFLRCLRQRNCIGMVAEQGEKVVGFMVYEMHPDRLHLLDFAVHPDHRRAGVGSQMVAKLAGKLAAHRRTRLTLDVRETNLDAQLFFRSQGFRAVGLKRAFYEDLDEDAIRMQHKLPGVVSEDIDEPANNRISQYEEG